MVLFDEFDDHMDASAVLSLLCSVSLFSGTVLAAANRVRNERNDWAHVVFDEWNEVKFQHSFAEMEKLVKAMALPSSNEGKVVGELRDWQNKGDCFLHVDVDVVCLVSRDILQYVFCLFVSLTWIVDFVHSKLLKLWCIAAELIQHSINIHFIVTS